MYLKKSKVADLKTFYTMSLQKHIGKNLNPKSLKEFKKFYSNFGRDKILKISYT